MASASGRPREPPLPRAGQACTVLLGSGEAVQQTVFCGSALVPSACPSPRGGEWNCLGRGAVGSAAWGAPSPALEQGPPPEARGPAHRPCDFPVVTKGALTSQGTWMPSGGPCIVSMLATWFQVPSPPRGLALRPLWLGASCGQCNWVGIQRHLGRRTARPLGHFLSLFPASQQQGPRPPPADLRHRVWRGSKKGSCRPSPWHLTAVRSLPPPRPARLPGSCPRGALRLPFLL